MGSKRRPAVRRVNRSSVKQSGAKMGGGKLKYCTGEKGRATPPNCGKLKHPKTNP